MKDLTILFKFAPGLPVPLLKAGLATSLLGLRKLKRPWELLKRKFGAMILIIN